MKDQITKKNVLLIAEDDDDHYFLIQNAFQGAKLEAKLCRVTNGVDLLQYLHHEGVFQDKKKYPLPSMIILDLNLPKKDGRAVLKEIGTFPDLKGIPITVLTTSINEEDRNNSYKLGAKFFIKKPVLFKEYVELIKMLEVFWASSPAEN
ncbi:MAG: response regulator [Deltaproteobacteria bacterium]|nr:response regulator [Deltaproteobacteria bacterium]